ERESYDNSQVADAAVLAHPRVFTLVGPKGTRVVATTAQVYLDEMVARTKSAALEIEGGDAIVALDGTVADASWIPLVGNQPDARTIGKTGAEVIYDQKTSTWRLPRCYRYINLDGQPIGGIHIAGVDYVVL